MDIKIFLNEFPYKRLFTYRIHSLIKRNAARGSIYRTTRLMNN